MLQFTLGDGRVVRRVFVGWVRNLADLDVITSEIRGELREKTNLMVEVWEDVVPAKRGKHLPKIGSTKKGEGVEV